MDSSDERQATLRHLRHYAKWHKYRKNQYLWYFWYRNATWRFGVSGANLCYWLLYMTSSQPMSGPWCVWGISTIFSSVGMSLGSAKYDTYAL